eukprot:308869-Pelagomonas_calceolata.AAC.3
MGLKQHHRRCQGRQLGEGHVRNVAVSRVCQQSHESWARVRVLRKGTQEVRPALRKDQKWVWEVGASAEKTHAAGPASPAQGSEMGVGGGRWVQVLRKGTQE